MSRKANLIVLLTSAEAAVATLVEKLEAAKAKVVTLQGQIANFDALEALDVGSEVIVVVGRGETKVETIGTIRAVKAGDLIPAKEEGGEPTVGERLFKVEVSRTGDAFDSEFVTVRESQVSIPVSEVDAGTTAEEAAVE